MTLSDEMAQRFTSDPKYAVALDGDDYNTRYAIKAYEAMLDKLVAD